MTDCTAMYCEIALLACDAYGRSTLSLASRSANRHKAPRLRLWLVQVLDDNDERAEFGDAYFTQFGGCVVERGSARASGSEPYFEGSVGKHQQGSGSGGAVLKESR